MLVTDITKKTLHKILRASIAKGSAIYPDEGLSYNGALRRHRINKHFAKEFVSGMPHVDVIESVWIVLKRSHNGVYRNWSKKRFQPYDNKSQFRLNKGNSGNDIRYRLDSLFENMAASILLIRN